MSAHLYSERLIPAVACHCKVKSLTVNVGLSIADEVEDSTAELELASSS